MSQKRHHALVCSLLLLAATAHISANSLSHDISTGSLTGIDVSVSDSPNTPSYYDGTTTEYYETRKFLGRVVYTGPATTLTVSNAGPTVKSASNNRFYFTYVQSDGTAVPSRWREFFLVTRAKGMRHGPGDVQHDFSGVNAVVPNEGGTITIPFGAGPEEVAVGELGYREHTMALTGTNTSIPTATFGLTLCLSGLLRVEAYAQAAMSRSC